MRVFTKFTVVLAPLFVATLLLTSCRHLGTDQWPLIREVNVHHHFAANQDSEQVKEMIYGQDGKPLYCLDARFCWRDYEIEEYNFSGIFDCRLYPLYGAPRSPTLLRNTVHATRDWQTYGRFTQDDFVGLTPSDEGRSIVRKCGARGMIIEIEVFDVKKDNEGRLTASFDMIFRARNASSPEERSYAKGEIAAQDK